MICILLKNFDIGVLEEAIGLIVLLLDTALVSLNPSDLGKSLGLPLLPLLIVSEYGSKNFVWITSCSKSKIVLSV